MKRKRPLSLTCVALLLSLLTGLFVASAAADDVKHSDETTVYHAEGSKRVHVEGCRRLTSTEGMTKMTLAEARAKGLPLCSRCPETTTPRKTQPSDTTTAGQKDATAPTQDPILLWPNDPDRNSMAKLGKAVKGDGGKTRVTDIATPHLISYLVKDADTPRPTIILCPGGGYVRLVPSLHWPIAEWLNEQGLNAFILMYRCPSSREGKATPDLQRAIRMLRSNAKQWNVDPKRLGVLGTSAGGNLCVRASIGFKSDSYEPIDAIDKLSARPDFTVLFYPAYLAKRGTEQPSDWIKVPDNTPPTLIFTAKDDKGHYINSPVYEKVLKEAGVSVKAYYYPAGGHGFGIDTPATKTWPKRLLAWLGEQGVIEEVKR